LFLRGNINEVWASVCYNSAINLGTNIISQPAAHPITQAWLQPVSERWAYAARPSSITFTYGCITLAANPRTGGTLPVFCEPREYADSSLHNADKSRSRAVHRRSTGVLFPLCFI